MQARRYIVYRGGEKIAEISDQPGPLISAKAPPPAPDAKPALHPFLSATAYVPEEEGRLRDVLNHGVNNVVHNHITMCIGAKLSDVIRETHLANERGGERQCRLGRDVMHDLEHWRGLLVGRIRIGKIFNNNYRIWIIRITGTGQVSAGNVLRRMDRQRFAG